MPTTCQQRHWEPGEVVLWFFIVDRFQPSFWLKENPQKTEIRFKATKKPDKSWLS